MQLKELNFIKKFANRIIKMIDDKMKKRKIHARKRDELSYFRYVRKRTKYENTAVCKYDESVFHFENFFGNFKFENSDLIFPVPFFLNSFWLEARLG